MCIPTPNCRESKQTKGNNDDSMKKQRYDSLNKHSMEELAHIFAQLFEKPLLDQEGTNTS